MSRSPKVSVVITTFYRNEELARSIESVQEQTHENVEILVVDDSGEAHAESVVADYDVRYLPQSTNEGAVSSRNLGVSEAGGEFIHFLDDDDRLVRNAIERKLSVLTEDPSAVLTYSGLFRERDGVEFMPDSTHEDFLEVALAMRHAPCIPSTMLIDGQAAREVHPLPGEFHGAGDVALCIELAQRGDVVPIEEPLTNRGHSISSIANSFAAVRARRRIIEAYSHLYEECPESVLATAESGMYLTMTRALLNERRWSLQASQCLWKAASRSPSFRVELYLGAAITLLLGRTGWRAGQLMWARLFRNDPI